MSLYIEYQEQVQELLEEKKGWENANHILRDEMHEMREENHRLKKEIKQQNEKIDELVNEIANYE